MQTLLYVGGSHSRGRGRQNPPPSNRGNRSTPGRGQGMPSRDRGGARGGGTRPITTPQVTRPLVQRGGTTCNSSSRNAGRGFVPAGQSWGQSNGNNTSFAGGTC